MYIGYGFAKSAPGGRVKKVEKGVYKRDREMYSRECKDKQHVPECMLMIFTEYTLRLLILIEEEGIVFVTSQKKAYPGKLHIRSRKKVCVALDKFFIIPLEKMGRCGWTAIKKFYYIIIYNHVSNLFYLYIPSNISNAIYDLSSSRLINFRLNAYGIFPK